jgi:Ankyrin repeats (3 copies)
MTISAPGYSVMNGQLRVKSACQAERGPATAKLELSSEFFLVDTGDMDISRNNHDGHASITSSTMSDDASWLSEPEDDLEESERLELAHEAAQQVAKMVRDRSTASLGAYFSKSKMTSPSQQQQQKRPRTAGATMMALVRNASVADMSTCGRKACLRAVQKVSAQEASGVSTANNSTKPSDHLAHLLETKLDRVPFDALGDYFLKATPEHIAAWDGELLRAIRNQDLALVKKMHQAGATLQASNRFGESILHVCVRRGSPAILRYLLQEGQVSPKVHCDYGRTPLHDALWTFSNEPNSLQMIALLLKQCPEMLLVTDKRGFTPLDYVPREHWNDCCILLDRCLPLLVRLKNNGRS